MTGIGMGTGSTAASGADAAEASARPGVPPGMRLLCLGLGYSARAFVGDLPPGTAVTGTTRDAGKAAALAQAGIAAVRYDGIAPSASLAAAIGEATHILVSASPGPGASPGADADPFLRHHRADIAAAPRLAWIGYLSTVGVYGDHHGAWVDEDAECRPALERGKERLLAERDWQAVGEAAGVPVGVFRLAGIYGPGRNPLAALAAGRARRIVRPGQVFNRIHVDDIARVLRHAIARPAARIYNVADGEPAPPEDVVAFAAALMGLAPPPEVPFEAAGLSEMGRSFYGEGKRSASARIRDELGVRLAYPTYREGLTALWTSGRWRG
jgi:nucleoside-diphosphate-sugar epimerase